jgi:photosystem II stability/assembly factor-like uncharacterized protein
MSKFTLIPAALVVCLLMASGVHAEGFHSVSSPNGIDVWAVGNGGAVFRSFDGGATWGSFGIDTTTLRAVFTVANTVWMGGDGGIVHHSTNGGDNWTTQTINGGVTLRALFFPTMSAGWAAGDNGSITVTTDGGISWSAQISGTAVRLNTLWFADSLTGYAAGNNGVLLKTMNGGSTWISVGGGGWTVDLLGLGGKGSTLYVTGSQGFCRKSTDGGLSWQALRFQTDSRSDLTGVYAVHADTAFFIGGGGYIRSTGDGGTSFAWGLHGMHARLKSIHMMDSRRGWACSDRNNAVLRTVDGGATWLLPTGTTLTLAWTRKLVENSSIGNTFVIDPWNRDRLYCALGDSIYRSTDRGETWSFRARIPSGGATHSFFVSPKDSNLWIAANTGGGDAVKRTTNAGTTWSNTIQRSFTSYGMPLEMNPDKPDTLYFAPDGTGSGGSDANGILYRSTNFGLTWDTLATTKFRSPCDLVIVPDSNAMVYVGDGITGSGLGKLWRSEDEGKSWALIDSMSGSEIPTVSISRVKNSEAFNTAWSSGGFRKTTNYGLSWSQVAATSSAWGTDVAKDDPNVVMFGVYGGGISYLSTNAGATFPSALQASLSGSNYAILAYDRATIFAQQSGGVYKLGFTYAVPVTNNQTLNLTIPNGGENWQYNSVHQITWTSGNLSNVRLQYQTSPAGIWQTIVASTPASAGTFAWAIPNAPTTQARVRISDPFDGNPIDSSTTTFTISVAAISATPESLAFDTTDVGNLAADTIRLFNGGTAPLVVSSVSVGTVHFAPGRTSFTIPPGGSDTLSVVFSPVASGRIVDTLVVANSSPVASFRLPLSGEAKYGIPSQITPQNGAQFVGTPVWFSWNAVPTALAYRLQVAADSGFMAPLVDDSTLGETSLQVGTLTEGTGYFWRVRATLTAGPTAWGSAWKFTTAATVTQLQLVQPGWNLLSLPLLVPDPGTTVLYPTALSGAFAYTGPAGYIRRDTLSMGEGFWIKFPAAGSVGINGVQTGNDTVSIAAGWNLIGSVSASIDTGAIGQIPTGLVASPYYGYDGGYLPSDSLRPGEGYWVKARLPGLLILAPPATVAPAAKALLQRANGKMVDLAGRKGQR